MKSDAGRVVVLTWAAIAEVGLVGVGVVWLITTAGARAGYGLVGSLLVLAVSAVLTVAAGVVVLRRLRVRGSVGLVLGVLLAVSAAAVVPLMVVDFATGSGAGDILFFAVAGMVLLAGYLIRAARMSGREAERA